mmetsp:Transcript_56288/g.150465  ORF Transcript_56288/g.150465 Transcript_56288/m.150465 type:complete len:221 (-) Transcript_56288:1772-2434(-)
MITRKPLRLCCVRHIFLLAPESQKVHLHAQRRCHWRSQHNGDVDTIRHKRQLGMGEALHLWRLTVGVPHWRSIWPQRTVAQKGSDFCSFSKEATVQHLLSHITEFVKERELGRGAAEAAELDLDLVAACGPPNVRPEDDTERLSTGTAIHRKVSHWDFRATLRSLTSFDNDPPRPSSRCCCRLKLGAVRHDGPRSTATMQERHRHQAGWWKAHSIQSLTT